MSKSKRVLVTTALVVALATGLSWLISWQSNSQWHLVSETLAVCIASFAALVGWVRYQATRERSALLILCTFVATAVLDAVHLVLTTELLVDAVPSAFTPLVPWSWLASRMMLGLGLYLSWLVATDSRIHDRLSTRNTPLLVGALAVAMVSLALVLPFPQSTYPKLWVPRPAEWIPGAFFALTFYGYWRQGRWQTHRFERWLMGSLLVAIVAQWLVMPFSQQWYDSRFDVAHLLKVISYGLVAVGWLAEIAQSSRRLEQLTRQHEASIAELARANEGLRVFVRSASHDLKAPIRHIAGFSGFLLEHAKDRLTDQEAGDLQRIRHAAEHMSKLLESLLRFAKFDAGSLQPAQFSVNQAVDAAVIQLPMKDQTRVTYEDLGSLVGDQSLLTLVFQNLIENGLKYTRQADSQVVVRTEPTEDGVMVSVRDDGIGVDPTQSDRIFEPGVRAVGESEFEGTGFGLATCARIIQAHEGKIWVESNEGPGSTFKFVLPGSTFSATT